MKEEVGQIDASPSKRLYLSIIADYDLNRSVCELVDNALDNWTRNGRNNNLRISVEFDYFQQRIRVSDNSGGVPEGDLKVIVSPGATSNKPSDELIGLFGVGTKRAVVALSQDVTITTRHNKGKTLRVEFDDEWLRDNEDWSLPVYHVNNIEPGTTVIELQRLRHGVDEQKVSLLSDHLRATYAKFLDSAGVDIEVDDKKLEPLTFDNWAYPPDFPPQTYEGEMAIEEGHPIQVRITAGLANQWSPGGGEYGVYFYCNDRLIARALRSFDVGFIRKAAGLPHPSSALARVIVSLRGEPLMMPWNSSKSDIDTKNETFIALRDFIVRVVSEYTALSRRLQHDWQDSVFQYDRGRIVSHKVADFPKLKKTYLPPLPRARLSYPDLVSQLNKELGQTKPWVVGLYETILAVDRISRTHLSQKNRICLILLDSCLEIGFKEYLVHEIEAEAPFTDRRLLGLFERRDKVQTEVASHLKLPIDTWKKIDNYYWARCDLIHKRADVGISEAQVNDYRQIVEVVLSKMFGLTFPGTDVLEAEIHIR